MNTMDTILNTPKPSIPYDVFKQKYAPFIKTGQFHIKWVNEVSSNLFTEVDVINPDGSVRYTVPTIGRPMDTTLDQNATTIVNAAAMQQTDIQKMGILRSHLPKTIKFIEGRTTAEIKRWEAIFLDCGIDIKLPNNNPSNSVKTRISPQVDRDEW